MAFIETKYCSDCESETMYTNGQCNHCREKTRRQALAAWHALTTEEKMLDLHKRLLRVEAGLPTY